MVSLIYFPWECILVIVHNVLSDNILSTHLGIIMKNTLWLANKKRTSLINLHESDLTSDILLVFLLFVILSFQPSCLGLIT